MKTWKGVALGTAALFLGFCGGWRVVGDTDEPGTEERYYHSGQVDRVAAGLVGIGTGRTQGTGLVVDAAGVVLTSSQLVDPAGMVPVRTFTGDTVRGRVLARDAMTGLALLQVPLRGLPGVWSSTGHAPRPGTLVELAAYRSGEGLKTGIGFVPARPTQGGRLRVFPVVPTAGDSTFPLGTVVVGAQGRVLGMITLRGEPGRGTWTAVALDTVFEAAMAAWREAAPSSRIAVVGTDVTPSLVEHLGLGRVSGVLIQEESTPRGTLKPGDILYQVDDTIRVRTMEDLQKAVRRLPPESAVPLRVRRGKKDTTVTEIVSPHP